MGNIEMLGSPSEQNEQDEQNEREKIFSAEEFKSLIGTEIVEIRDYQGENANDWIKNFKDGLSRIKILISSEEAADFCDKSILEKVPLGIEALEENLGNFNSGELSEDEKNFLLKKLIDIFN